MAVKKTGFVLGAVAGAGVAAAALAGAGLSWPPAQAQNERPQLIRAATAPMFAPPVGAPLSFADIFDRVSPAVVSIDVSSRVQQQRSLRQIPGFENFPFNLVPPQGQGQDEEGEDGDSAPTPQGRRALSSGSGFFISSNGYIVTNNHVVENAEEITVTLKDERELKARVIGRDEGTDLAVIKVEGANFPFVSFENASKPRVGDWVITVGNPFGLGGTATAGIVSAYGRDIGDRNFTDYIQIDAPINRGNSGGPTFDIYGRVIGVNTAIFSPSGGSVGIGFAIPSDVADTITKQLISGVKITRGYLGATIQTVTPEFAESIGKPDLRGAVVAGLSPGGPGEKGGLRQGDIVTALNGRPVRSNSELTRAVAGSRSGDNLALTVLRDGKQITLNIRSGTRPSEAELSAQNEPAQQNGPGVTPPGAQAPRPVVLGLTLSPIDEAARRRFNIGAEVRGVVVLRADDSTDAGAKLRAGDVITAVRVGDQTRPVTGPADVTASVDAAKRAGRANILMLVTRSGPGGGTIFLPVRVE